MAARVQARGSCEGASNALRMLELIAFIPTLCALSLVVFGLARYKPTAPVVLYTIAGAIICGPVVVTLFGFVGWLLMIVAGTAAATAYATNRHRPLRG